MKNLLLIIGLFLMFINTGNTQNSLGKSDDLQRIALTPIVPDQLEIPAEAKNLLLNKMNQMATQNGLSGGGENPRFIIAPNVVILTKDIIPGPPQMIAQNVQVMFYIADVVTKTIFTQASIEAKGVGTNETKAYIAALKGLKPNSPEFKNMMDKGKQKIIEYYNSQCDFILKDAQALAGMKEYAQAIQRLTSVPEVCKECYDKTMAAVPAIYKEYMDYQSCIDLSAAKAAWSNLDAAKAAGFLSNITPDSKCFTEAQALVEEIKTKLLADEKKEWDFKLKMWDDGVDLEKQRIEAARQVGVEWAKNPHGWGYYNDLGWLYK